jgi:hypothetical protein
MKKLARILLLLANLLALANLAHAGIGAPEDLLNRARRGLTQSAGGNKQRAIVKNHKTVAICVG